MPDIKGLERVLDDNANNNDGKLDTTELQLLDDFLNGKIVTDYVDKNNADESSDKKPNKRKNFDSEQEQEDNKSYTKFIKYIECPGKIEALGTLLFSQLKNEKSENLPYYSALIEPLKERASLSPTLADYVLGKLGADGATRSGGLIAQMTDAINSKSTSISKETKESTSGMDYYKDFSDILFNPETLKKFDVQKLDNWIVQSISLRNTSQKDSFLAGYKSYLQSQLESIKKEGNKDKISSFEKQMTSIESQVKDGLDKLSSFLLGPSISQLLSHPNVSSDQMVSNPEYQKTLNTVFHFDRDQYKEMLSLYPNQKVQVQNSVLAYIKLMNQGMKISGLDDIKSKDIALGSELNNGLSSKNFDDDKFYITKSNPDGSKKYFALVTDPTGKGSALQEVDIAGGNKLSVYFGDASTGNALNLQSILQSDDKGLQRVISKDPEISSLFKQSDTGEMQIATGSDKIGGKSMNTYGSLSEAFTAFFSSPLFRQIQKMFYALGALSPDGLSNESRINLDFLNTQDKLDTLISNPDPDVSVALSDCGLSGKQPSDIQKAISAKISTYKWSETASGKSMTSSYLGGSKDYFCNYLSPADQIRFLYAKPLQGTNNAIYTEQLNTSRADGKKKEDPTPAVSTDIPKKHSEALTETSFVSGSTIDALKIKEGVAAIQGKVDLCKDDPSKPYMTVDDQSISLTKNGDHYEGSVITQGSDGKFFTKKVVFSQDYTKVSVTSTEVNASFQQNYKQKFYDQEKYNTAVLTSTDSMPLFIAHCSQEFPSNDNKVSAIYSEVKTKLSTSLPQVQKTFAVLQHALVIGSQNANTFTKESIKQHIDAAKNSLLSIKGSTGEIILQQQVDSWYAQFSGLSESKAAVDNQSSGSAAAIGSEDDSPSTVSAPKVEKK